jgi:hypothetical protein
MQETLWPREASTHFDRQSWEGAYRRGYSEGHAAGALCGEQALRDRLLRRLHHLETDMRLELLDLKTRHAVLHAVVLLIEDRKQP